MLVTDRQTDRQTGYPSVDRPWLKYYEKEVLVDELPNESLFDYLWERRKGNLEETMIEYLGRRICRWGRFLLTTHLSPVIL